MAKDKKPARKRAHQNPVKKKMKDVMGRLAPNSAVAVAPEFDQTIDEIENKGGLPDNATMESRFPGISTSTQAKKEFYLLAIFTLRMRGATRAKIAEQLKMSERNVAYYMQEMRKTMGADVAKLSFEEHVGRSVAVFRELQAQALKVVYGKRKLKIGDKLVEEEYEVTDKLRGIREAAYMEHSINATLKQSGFFTANRLTPQPSARSHESDMSKIHRSIDAIFEGIEYEEQEEITADNYELSDDDVSVVRLN